MSKSEVHEVRRYYSRTADLVMSLKAQRSSFSPRLHIKNAVVTVSGPKVRPAPRKSLTSLIASKQLSANGWFLARKRIHASRTALSTEAPLVQLTFVQFNSGEASSSRRCTSCSFACSCRVFAMRSQCRLYCHAYRCATQENILIDQR